MIALLSVFLFCATVAYVSRTVSVAIVSRWGQDRDALYSAKSADRDLEARKITLTEREFALREKIAASNPASVRIPDDLIGRIRMWDDPMAQENEKQVIMGLWMEHQDWDTVRKNLGTLEPEMRTEIAALSMYS